MPRIISIPGEPRMIRLDKKSTRFMLFVGCLFFHRRSFQQAPLHFAGCLLFHRRSFEWALCVFAGCLFFHQRSFERASLRFMGCLFFHQRFCGVPLFSSEVFWTSPFAFCGVPLFSSEVFWMSQWMRGLIAHLCSWLRYFVWNACRIFS
jgi:hypothetical protein